MFGYLIVFKCIVFLLRFYFSVFSKVLASIEKIYKTRECLTTFFSNTPKSAFAWKCGQTQSFVFHHIISSLPAYLAIDKQRTIIKQVVNGRKSDNASLAS